MDNEHLPSLTFCEFCGEDPCECGDLHSQEVATAPQVVSILARRNEADPGRLDMVDVEAGAVMEHAWSMGEVRRSCNTHGWNLLTNRIAEASVEVPNEVD